MEQDLENAGWRPETDDGFVGHVGGLWRRDINGRMQMAFIARPFHANRNGVVHGGMLMTFVDRAFGQFARVTTGATRGATISLNHNFLAPVRIGDLVEIEPEIVKVTTRLVFVAGTAHVADASVISAQGIFRVSHSPR
ncbi:PaaI family thioesterase [Roseinatronobacter alkalisoli]|uniref:PaaI family thioesterase n=1 Tax=Roseinatronobacter alkalisoli TaxID=3028235 RepID=A0ABT5TDC2_9RHOB|nr:PaaI family thioesterase [Roseinatronobacter sp. HJB301]MDD7973124.1 PaaI family thioesterase [Roseinatronobacter sp. HJB301]